MKIGAVIHRFRTCTSTNELAREMAEAGAQEGTAVISDEQIKGKGTKGRAWFSVSKKGLYVSVILRPRDPAISLLPLVAGLAAQEAVLRTAGLKVRLKWPNDVLWENKKLGGILCESGFSGSSLEYVVMGIGLNIGHRAKDFPENIRGHAVSLLMATGKNHKKSILFRNLCQSLNRWYRLFCEGNGREIVRFFEKELIFSKGDQLRVVKEGEPASGVFKGLDDLGGLLLERLGEVTVLYSAEVVAVEQE